MVNVTLIKRSQPFCGGCQILQTQLSGEGIAHQTLDITEQPELVDEYELTTVPTLIIEKNGEVMKLAGVQPIEKVKELIGE